MDKPITIDIENFKQELRDIINNSQLHPFILDSIFKDIYNEIHILYQNQILQDQKMYKESIDENKDKNE